jgi:DNA-binding MurR/RpiR family transcriptional regulator
LTIIDNISDNMESLSNKQKLIAKYLIRNSGKIGFMSLKEISEETNISEVTILNFCKSIGVDSFTELKRLFQELVKKQLYIPKEIKYSLLDIDNIDDAYNNAIQIQRFNYERIIKDNDINILKEVSQLIIKASRVYICSQGMSRIIAEYLNRRLKLISIDSRIVEIGDILLSSIELKKATKEDCFILISFPKYSHNVLGLSEYLTQNHIPFVSITDSDKSPLVKNSKHVLKCYSDSLVFHNFISSTICLIEILLVVLSFNMKEDLMLHLDNLEQIQTLLMKNINNQ